MTTEALAAAILLADLNHPDEIPPHRWTLYAGTIASRLYPALAAAGYSIVSTEELEGLRAALRDLLDDTQHAEHGRGAPDYCGDPECPVARARAALEATR